MHSVSTLGVRIYVHISPGELYDKIAVLEIKLANGYRECQSELHELHSIAHKGFTESSVMYAELKEINQRIWDVGNRIRKKEQIQKFDAEFIYSARTMALLTDERAQHIDRINRFYSLLCKPTEASDDVI